MFILALKGSPVYNDPSMNILSPSTHVLDLYISMSSNGTLTFTFLICIKTCWMDTQNNYYERFPSKVILLNSLVLSRLDCASQI